METSSPAVASYFAAAFNAQHLDAVLSCFTADATYRDLFYGVHTGRAQLRSLFLLMFERGSHQWIMNRVVGDERTTMCQWTFTMRTTTRTRGTASATGRPGAVRFDGASVFETRDGLCHSYSEFFDRTAVLLAMGFSPAGTARIVSGRPAVEVLGPERSESAS